MALTKLIYSPEQASYVVTDGEGIVSQKLGGGPARYRTDQLNPASIVDVQWQLDRSEYVAFRSFYVGITTGGASPFLVDLIIDDSALTEHEAHFVPNTMALIGQSGHTYTIGAQLEIKPIAVSNGLAAAAYTLISSYGSIAAGQAVLADLEQFVNFDLPFTPMSLFLASEVGFWYDPSDLATLFQDSAGLIPVTAVGQTVGLMLDKVNGSITSTNLATNGIFALGASIVANGQFSSIENWTFEDGWSLAGNAASCDGTQAAQSKIRQVIPLLQTATSYRLTFDLTVTAGTINQLRLGGINDNVSFGSTATITYDFLTVDSIGDLQILCSSTFVGTVDNVKLQEFVVDSQWVFGDGWGHGDGFAICDGTQVANTSLQQDIDINIEAGKTYKITFDIIARTAGVITSLTLGGVNSTDNVFEVGSYSKTITTINATGDLLITGNNNWDGSIANVVVVEIAGVFAFQDEVLLRPTYQVDSGGRGLLRYNGVDQFMLTETLDFAGTDKMSVFVASHKLTDANEMLVEQSINAGANTGAVFMFNQIADYKYSSRGATVSAALTTEGFAAPFTSVLTGESDIGGDLVTLRVNGVEKASDTASSGVADYGDFRWYLGAREGISFPFEGDMYGVIVRGAASTTGEVENTEGYLAFKSGVVL